jgi:hypothetical protein
MVRPRHLRLLAVVVFCIGLLGLGATRFGPRDTLPASALRLGPAGHVQVAQDSAVLPARAADELQTASQLTPWRGLLVVATLALAAVPATHGRRLAARVDRTPTLLSRRHAVSLRAPPCHRLA